MVSDSRLSSLVLTVASLLSLAAAPLRAVDFPAAPLSDLSPDTLRSTAAAAIKEGAWSPWSDWLASLLRTAFSQPDIKDPAPITSTPAGSLALAQWRLIAVTGPDHCKAVADKDGTEFLAWLTANNEALHAYLASGPLDREITSRGLAIWRDLFNAHPDSRDGLWMRVAAATALAHTSPVKSLADGGDIDPLKRFQYFRDAHASHILAPSFDQAAVWELRYVVNSWARDEELAWVLNAMDPKNKSQARIGDACGMVPYRLENSKGVSVQNGPEYYEHQPVTLKLMHEVGGVCGAISKFGTAAAQAFGVPAMPVGQPGHCAFLWKDTPTSWRTGNDIEGWQGSSEHGGIHIPWGQRAAYILLAEAAHQNPAAFLRSEQATWSVPLAGPNALNFASAATAAQPLNAGAWQLLTKTATTSSAPLAFYQNLTRQLLAALPDHPLPLIDLLQPIESHLDLKDAPARTRFVSAVTSAIAQGNPAAQHNTAQRALDDLLARHAASLIPGGNATIANLKSTDSSTSSPTLSDADRTTLLSLVEAALSSASSRPDLQDALTGQWLPLMSSNPASLARAIQFFGSLFETARTNSDRKPAIALARRLILLAEQANDLPAAEKYSAACKSLLANP
jgi:hypothetical protein